MSGGEERAEGWSTRGGAKVDGRCCKARGDAWRCRDGGSCEIDSQSGPSRRLNPPFLSLHHHHPSPHRPSPGTLMSLQASQGSDIAWTGSSDGNPAHRICLRLRSARCFDQLARVKGEACKGTTVAVRAVTRARGSKVENGKVTTHQQGCRCSTWLRPDSAACATRRRRRELPGRELGSQLP